MTVLPGRGGGGPLAQAPLEGTFELRRSHLAAEGTAGRRHEEGAKWAARSLAPWLQLLPWDPWASATPQSWQTVPWRAYGAWGGACCVGSWAVGTMPGRGDHRALPWPHHLLTIYLKILSPRCCRQGLEEWPGLPAWPPLPAKRRTEVGLRPPLSQQPEPRAIPAAPGCLLPFLPHTFKGPVRGFREGRRMQDSWDLVYPKSQHIGAFSGVSEQSPFPHRFREHVSTPGLVLSARYSPSHMMFTATVWGWYDCDDPHFCRQGS